MSAARTSDFDHIVELFAAFGTVSVRRMFGGAGVFADGAMIALVNDGVIYLKANAATIPDFEREGLAPFSYSTRSGRRSLMSYWRMPERLYDDPEELADWSRRALVAAHNAGTAGKRGAGPRRPVKRRARR